MAEQLSVEIVIDDGNAKRTLKTFESQAEKSGESVGNSLSSGLSMGAKAGLAAAAAAAIAAGYAIKKGLDAAIDEAIKGENALNQFNAALKTTGQFTPEASQRFVEFTAALQKQSTVADDVIQQNAALLVSVGKLSGEGLEKATKSALDLAAGLQIDVATAFDLVSKAAAGNTGALSRYGIRISQSIPENERFAETLKQIQASFGGQALAQINTFGGVTKQLSNNFGDLLEEFGKMFTKSPVLIGWLKNISDWFAKAATAVADWLKGKDLIGDFTKALLSVASVIINYVLPPFELLYNIGKMVWNAIALFAQTAIVAILTSISGFTSALAMVSDKFSGINDAVQSALTGAQSTLGDFANKTTNAVAGALDFNFTESANKTITSMQNETARLTDEAKNVGLAMGQAAKEGVQQGLDINSLGGYFKAIADAFANTSNRMRLDANQLAKNMWSALGSGIVNSFAAMGEAFGKGEDGFSAMGKSMLRVLGDLAIQLGGFMLLAGTGLAVLPGFQASIGAAIAGAALIILGGVLKGLAGGGGSSSSAPSAPVAGQVNEAGGGITAAPSEITALEDTAPRERGQAVVINVQGNILDRRETGLALADVINESFGTNAVAIPGGAVV